MDGDQPIDLHVGKRLLGLVRPEDLQTDGGFVLAKSEMQCQIILIALAGARIHLTRERSRRARQV